MSYDEKYRKRTLEYRQEGHTLEQTSKVFKVAIITIRKWEKGKAAARRGEFKETCSKASI